MASKIYRHYGAVVFDSTHELGGGHMGKPDGLWASPKKSYDCSYTWKDFCISEEFRLESLKHYFDFRLKKGTRILRIHSISDIIPYLEKKDDYDEYSREFPLLAKDPTFHKKLNMKRIHKQFDGMEVYMGQNYSEFHYSDMFNVWDVDSLVIWNLDRVIPL